jgi:hypothetical protein
MEASSGGQPDLSLQGDLLVFEDGAAPVLAAVSPGHGGDEIPMHGVRVWIHAAGRTSGRDRSEVRRAGEVPWTRPAIERLVALLRARGATGRLVATDQSGRSFIDESLA